VRSRLTRTYFGPHRHRQVGMADLTVGVLGVLCVWIRGNFWLATAIVNAVWLLGDAIGHLRQMVLHNNHAANNAGVSGCGDRNAAADTASGAVSAPTSPAAQPVMIRASPRTAPAAGADARPAAPSSSPDTRAAAH
jgi:hypothetical protein